jgi:Lon protease-like protein
MIQPDPDEAKNDVPDLLKVGCLGRITSYAETPDDRILITLTGVSRFEIVDELDAVTPYRQVIANYHPFAIDLVSDLGASEVNRPALLKAFRDYLNANNMNADWEQVDSASTEVLVNTLSLLAPYPPEEKQALLEAPDLKTRADVLVALTEVALRRMTPGGKSSLQ